MFEPFSQITNEINWYFPLKEVLRIVSFGQYENLEFVLMYVNQYLFVKEPSNSFIWKYRAFWLNISHKLDRGHRELLDGRLCRPDSEQWSWTSNSCTMTVVKLCWQNKVHISLYFLCLVFLIQLLAYSY